MKNKNYISLDCEKFIVYQFLHLKFHLRIIFLYESNVRCHKFDALLKFIFGAKNRKEHKSPYSMLNNRVLALQIFNKWIKCVISFIIHCKDFEDIHPTGVRRFSNSLIL